MASARPIVATAVGGVPEAIRHEKEALLVPKSNARALAAAMIRLLEDRSLAKRLAVAARRRAEKEFSLSAMLAGYERFYDELQT